VLVDIDEDTFNIDPEAAIAAMTQRTKAVIPVHLFGQPADLHPLINGVVRTDALMIEDAAQAIGATYDGHAVGSFGAYGCFSFFPSKNLGCFGDGGLVTTKNQQLARRIQLLRNHGMEPKYHHHMVGGNFRLDALHAAVLRVKLPYLDAWTAGRQRNAQRYRGLFAEAGLTEVVKLPVEAPNRTHIYNQFVIRAPDRDRLRGHLQARGIGTEVYYPVPFHLQKCFAYLGYAPGAFPRAEAAAKETLALPIYGELTEAHQAEVVDAIQSFYGK
jgi:dTDP-4-amino-4,6-dideoxygalactose transaminase